MIKVSEFYLTKGVLNAILYRFKNSSYYWVPLTELNNSGILKDHKNKSKNSVEYVKPDFYNYSIVTNAIIHIGNECYSALKVLDELELLFCEHLEVVIDKIIRPDDLKVLDAVVSRGFETISLHICNLEISSSKLEAFLTKYLQLLEIVVYNYRADYEVKLHEKRNTVLSYRIKKFSHNHCGVVNVDYFNFSKQHIIESLHHNSCLNRKITIDNEGNIKNCPSMKVSFGNISDTTLAEAIEKPGFKKYWDINKDKIHVCKDCEFRYICTDCRAYVEDPEDILSKPLKCGYNPYTGEWSEWSTNPLKQKAIDYYKMRNIVQANI